MRTDDHLNDKNQSGNESPALMIFSLGAITGAVILVIFSLSNRIKAAFRQTQLQSQNGLAGESDDKASGSLDAALPSPVQPDLAAGEPTDARGVEMPVPNPIVSDPAKKGRGFSSTATASPAVPTPGFASKTSQPMAKTAAAVEAHASNRWSAPTRYIMGVFLFLSVIVVLFIGRSAIPMVIVAALLALLVDPLIRFLMRRMRIKKGLAVGLTYFFVVAIVVLIPLLAIPSLVQAFNFVTQIDTQLVARQSNEVIQSISSALQTNPGVAAILQPTLDSLSIKLEGFASASQVGVSGLNLSVADFTS